MHFDSNTPIYVQVANDIKQKIISGELKAGDKIPSNRELSLIYKINPNTVQRVYRELEQENLCFAKRGIGMFITEDEAICKKLKEESIEKLIAELISKIKAMNVSREEFFELAEKIGGKNNAVI